MSIISIKNVNMFYEEGNSKNTVLNNVNLEVSKGELVAIIGPSGSGKTTLLSILGALIKPSSVKVKINGKNLDLLSQKNFPNLD